MTRFILPTAIALSAFLFSLQSCDKEETCDCQVEESCRSGAVCGDGTTTTATGSGACSGHGGVDHWTCR